MTVVAQQIHRINPKSLKEKEELVSQMEIDFADDLENWMGNLPESIRKVPIIYMSIPGSHNSMTYGINSESKIGPDAENSVRRLYRCFPCIVRRWAITQEFDAIGQLKRGVRYFDLRFCLKTSANTNDKFYFVHGLYSVEITKPLQEIYKFLSDHPKEFVVIDCQHFYGMAREHHILLQQKLVLIFGEKIFERNSNELNECSLHFAEKMSKQVLIIYRYNNLLSLELWPEYVWPTPWPNKADVTELRPELDRLLKRRTPNTGFVSQCILTPDASYIALRCFSSLRNVAKVVNKELLAWVQEQRPGPFKLGQTPTVNVFLADFVDIKYSEFCKIVINLNVHLKMFPDIKN